MSAYGAPLACEDRGRHLHPSFSLPFLTYMHRKPPRSGACISLYRRRDGDSGRLDDFPKTTGECRVNTNFVNRACQLSMDLCGTRRRKSKQPEKDAEMNTFKLHGPRLAGERRVKLTRVMERRVTCVILVLGARVTFHCHSSGARSCVNNQLPDNFSSQLIPLGEQVSGSVGNNC